MKKIPFTLMSLLLLVSVTHAGLAPSILPPSSHYQGQYNESFLDGTLDIHLEFAVYTDNQFDSIGYTGDSDYVYAYQVFSEQSSTAALTYFALTGIDSSTIADVQNDIGEAGSLKEGSIQSDGKAPTSSDFNLSVTKAIWKWGAGAIVQGEQSWFLFLFSDFDYELDGGIEVQQANDDIPTPGVPEPTTLALLGFGTVLSLRRKK